MTKRDAQASEYAAESRRDDAAPSEPQAATIARFLRSSNWHRAAAWVEIWAEESAELRQRLSGRHAVTKPPAESSD